MEAKLTLDGEAIGRCRKAAGDIADSVLRFAAERTTVSIERATLRLMGVEGADAEGVPLVNRVVDSDLARPCLGTGISLLFGRAMAASGLDPAATAEALADNRLDAATLKAVG